MSLYRRHERLIRVTSPLTPSHTWLLSAKVQLQSSTVVKSFGARCLINFSHFISVLRGRCIFYFWFRLFSYVTHCQSPEGSIPLFADIFTPTDKSFKVKLSSLITFLSLSYCWSPYNLVLCNRWHS